MKQLAKTKFEISDQFAFAKLSGDRNPMHIDFEYARRTQAGQPVVHGMHVAMWALDILLGVDCEASEIQTIRVNFLKFFYLGKSLELIQKENDEAKLKYEIVCDGLTLLSMRLVRTDRNGPAISAPESNRPHYRKIKLSQPRESSIEELEDLSEAITNDARTSEILLAFPNLSNELGVERVRSMLLLSTVVGLHCPGLHSIFSKLTINLSSDELADSHLNYHTESVDTRFNMVAVKFYGSGIFGDIQAFIRQKPIIQSGILAFRKHVENAQFNGVTALVIGGSRGLGESAAKILLAGGARVTITYMSGKNDALRIQDDANKVLAENPCDVLRYDALESPEDQLADILKYNCVFYFATGQIFKQKLDHFNYQLFNEFSEIYLRGFSNLCDYMDRQKSDAHIRIFYPSSVAVVDRPRGMTEYAMAKSAAEILCQDITANSRRISVLTERLPRIETDQTATVAPVPSVSAIDSMLPIVKKLCAIESSI